MLIRNKIDLLGAEKQNQDIIRISCKSHHGISELITTLSTIIKNKVSVFKKQYLLMLNARQMKALLKIEERLKLAYEDLKNNKDLSLCLSILYGAMEEYNTLIRPVEKNEILKRFLEVFALGNKKIIIAGGGHAGIEAALAISRMGGSCTIVTMDKHALGRLSCNPAVGGLGKSHLVKEIDALGGVMGHCSDSSRIQFKMLNKTKGRAVWANRVQVDKKNIRK